MDMLKTVKQAFKVPEMRAKILFTVMMLAIFCIGSHIPVPGIDRIRADYSTCSTCSPEDLSVTLLSSH